MSKPQEQPVKTTDHDHDDDEEIAQPGCGILARYPVLSVLLFAATGIGAGVALSFWAPDDMGKKDVLLKWLGLIGDLFVRTCVKQSILLRESCCC